MRRVPSKDFKKRQEMIRDIFTAIFFRRNNNAYDSKSIVDQDLQDYSKEGNLKLRNSGRSGTILPLLNLKGCEIAVLDCGHDISGFPAVPETIEQGDLALERLI